MNWAWANSIDQLWRSPAFPMWMTLAAAAFFALVLLITLVRAEKSVANGALTVITLLAIAIAITSLIRSFDAGRAGVPQTAVASQVPALACLDGIAGDNVEAACERVIFGSAETTAAAVSYTAAQLTRLSAFGPARPGQAAPSDLATLRRTLERDRYGLVAQVLTVRDGCTPALCAAFSSFADSSRIVANMNEHAYDNLVGRAMLAWSTSAGTVASGAAMTEPGALPMAAPSVPTGKPTTIDFPTANSIPPVNIMNPEPVKNAPAAAAPSPAASNAHAAVPAPQPAPRQPRAPSAQKSRPAAPTQLAPPPAQADDN